MRCFKKILLYVVPDAPVGPATAVALRLARRDGGTIMLVDCVRRVPFFVRWVQPDRWRRHLKLLQARQSRLEGLAEDLRQQGVSVATQLFCGRPTHEIAREVLHNHYDLVIKSAEVVAKHSRSLSSGATAVQLMRVCPCRVCVVDFAEGECYDQILAAVNPQTSEATHCELNSLVLDTAVSLARQQGGQVSVVAAWTAFAQSVLHVKLADEEVEAYIESTRVNATRRLERLLQPFSEDIDSRRVHLVQGEANQVIVEFAQRCKADMLVVGAVPRSGLGGLLVGNTAEDVIRKVPCSVLVVKPDASCWREA